MVSNELDVEPEVPVIDLEALKERCLGNLNLVERVLAKFTGQVDADLDELEQAITNQDATKAAQLAHRIKGIAGSVEARQLYEDATVAEQRALENRLSDLNSDLTRLRSDRTVLAESLKYRLCQ